MRPGLNPSEVGHFRSHHVLDVKKMSLEWLSQFCESSSHVTAIYGLYLVVHRWDELSCRMTKSTFMARQGEYHNRVSLLKKLGVDPRLGLEKEDIRLGTLGLNALLESWF